MSKYLQRDLERLQNQLMSLCGSVERMIGQATEVLCERKTELSAEVLAADEVVDQTEVEIEEECLKILALHQPFAGDLRHLASVLKINSDLERIADLACNIAERGACLHQYPYFPIPDNLPRMIGIATEMVRLSLDAFVDTDAELARKIIDQDRSVDELHLLVIAELKSLMEQESDIVDAALHCFSASRHVERIADHAVNIAEDVIYLATGEIVRHRFENI
ncbi:phosphate signaling complex protein PhoU [bacterium]|nr:phosphate signaling complex protein PhoU [bacterium]